MKYFVIATAAGITVAGVINPDELPPALATLELGAKDSTLALRYALVNGEIVDQFPGKTDEAALKLIEAARDAEHAASVANFKLTPNDFLRFLGAKRRIMVRTMAKGGDVVAEDILDMFNRATFIDSQDTDLKFALNHLKDNGGADFAKIVDDFYATGHTFATTPIVG